MGLFLILLLVGCDFLEVRDHHFASYHDAVEAGGVAKGWVLELVPTTARDLRVRYDLDTGEVVNAFTADRAAVAALLDSRLPGTPQPPRDIPRWVAWDSRAELVLLRTATGKRVGMTVTAHSGEIYMWIPG